MSIVRPRNRLEGMLYRTIMRITHHYGWHYAPKGPVPLPNDEPRGTSFCWCQWCGLRGTVWHPPKDYKFGAFGPSKTQETVK